MAKYNDLVLVKALSERGDTNSKVDLLQEPNSDNFFVRKIIYGIDQPLYKAIFMREVSALYKLNHCSNVVKIFEHFHMKSRTTDERVGCIFLEYIPGEPLSRIDLTALSSKDKFSILSQLLCAVEAAHSNGIIHRDINPTNIMITDNSKVKVIDFGICKIKEMVSGSTVYNMGTNRYSAPEVHLHSENATEQSDLYSIGAVVYYLFTGNKPPLPEQFQNEIDVTSGIDVDLKEILKKLVSIEPNNRYNSIFDLRIALTGLFERFLSINRQINISIPYEVFNRLKKVNLIPQSSRVYEPSIISQNFIDLYAFKEGEIYRFMGTNYWLDCIFNSYSNIFIVSGFKKVMPSFRERQKKTYTEISAKIEVIDINKVHRLSRNDNIEVKNIIDDYCEAYFSKTNVDHEYDSKYGTWRKLLNLMKESIESNIIRFSYDKFTIEDKTFIFSLTQGVFFGDVSFNKEQMFVYEKNHQGKKKIIPIGYYEDDYYDEDHIVLKIHFEGNAKKLPSKGILCLDYRQDIINVQRQLDALDLIEKEDVSCSFDLKGILSEVELPKSRAITGNYNFFNKKLDMSQQAAVTKALNSESLSIIQGPPGTGKTNVIIEIILQILLYNKRNPDLPEKKILLVSQSHPAVDKMIDDLIESSETPPNLIRIGRDEKLNNDIRETYGINYVKEQWITDVKERCKSVSNQLCKELNITPDEFEIYYKEFEKLNIKDKNQIIDKNVISHMHNKTTGAVASKKRRILEIQKQWMDRLSQCEEVELYIIKSTNIIAGTCTGFISNKVIRDTEFDYLIVDEAAKATFPELAVSFSKAKKIILVGDHKQLPPVLDEEIISNNKGTIDRQDFSVGLFERLYDVFPENNKHRLTVQYRMHPIIGTLISQVFYDNDIQNGIEKEKRQIGLSDYSNIAIEWLSTSSRETIERYEKKQGVYPHITYKNNLEVRVIKSKLESLDKQAKRNIKVAVITAYSAQKYALINMIKQEKYNHLQIEVDTVDAFQGSQKEIIIYSTVRSSDNKKRIGFLKSEARLNVAFSRAQSLLIIVGDHQFLNGGKTVGSKFPEIIKYIIENPKSCRITAI